MDECIFCLIASGKSPANILYADDSVIAFTDLHPLAPVHLLIIPQKHIASINEISGDDTLLLGHMVQVAKLLAEQNHINISGFRIVFNTGQHAGQSVHHLHLHLLGGKPMSFHF